jgi:hypothetical protein
LIILATTSATILAASFVFIVAYGLERADQAASILSFIVALLSLFGTILFSKAARLPQESPEPSVVGDELGEHSGSAELEATVAKDQEQWLGVRRILNRNRAVLERAAARLYLREARIGNTGLIALPGWQPSEPVNLGEVAATYARSASVPVVSGREREARFVLPKMSEAVWFSRYSDAMHQLLPATMQNRFLWRIAELRSPAPPTLAFGSMFYFDAIDVCEAVAHETARIMLPNANESKTASESQLKSGVSLEDLPLRRLIGDPFDLSRRAVPTAISTLVIRNSPDHPTCLLHVRDSKKVASAGGTTGTIPSGQFQPSSQEPGAKRADFDLWRNIMREYDEELLGNVAHDGNDSACDYAAYPFTLLNQGREDGRIRIYYLGLALNALTLWGEILTVAVVSPDIFDTLTPKLARVGEYELMIDREGQSVAVIQFDDSEVDKVRKNLGAACAGCLELALRHRSILLGNP